jgi:hypothetical protein
MIILFVLLKFVVQQVCEDLKRIKMMFCLFSLVDKSSRSKFYFIFEFCDHDLAGILRNANVKFSLGHIKSIMQQLLDGMFKK